MQIVLPGISRPESSFNKVWSRQPFCKLLFGQLFLQIVRPGTSRSESSFNKVSSRQPFCKLLFGQFFLQIVRPGTSSSGSSFNKVSFPASFLQSLQIDLIFLELVTTFLQIFVPNFSCNFLFKTTFLETFVPEKKVLQTWQFVVLG